MQRMAWSHYSPRQWSPLTQNPHCIDIFITFPDYTHRLFLYLSLADNDEDAHPSGPDLAQQGSIFSEPSDNI